MDVHKTLCQQWVSPYLQNCSTPSAISLLQGQKFWRIQHTKLKRCTKLGSHNVLGCQRYPASHCSSMRVAKLQWKCGCGHAWPLMAAWHITESASSLARAVLVALLSRYLHKQPHLPTSISSYYWIWFTSIPPNKTWWYHILLGRSKQGRPITMDHSSWLHPCWGKRILISHHQKLI